MNTYGYVLGNPIKLTDPAGQNPGAVCLIPGLCPAVVQVCRYAVTKIAQYALAGIAYEIVACTGDSCSDTTGEDGDEDDFCFTRWEEEDTRCWEWKGLGTRVVQACRSRASYRRNLCVSNGGRPDPSEPPEYNPFSDFPR